MSKSAPDQISPLAPACFPDLPHVGGVDAAVMSLGLYKHPRDDLIVVTFPEGANVGGAFTTSKTASADVLWCRRALGGGHARALVCNAGNSNAFTGPAGVAKNDATIAAVRDLAGCAATDVFLAATGVIGQPLAPERVASILPAAFAGRGAPDWERMARAIMTTDTFPKGAGGTAAVDGTSVAVAGIAKGSGMIAPNMATMLSFVFTDASLSPTVAQALVDRALPESFNAITVDGDTSTSDTLLLFATGAAGAPLIDDADDPRLTALAALVTDVMRDLALQIVRDGEGARKLVRIDIAGAADDVSARRIGLAIANSPLVKTAIAGEDANWGRVVMAVGKAGEPIDVSRLAIRFGAVWTARNGGWTPYDEAAVDAHMRGETIEIGVEIGVGEGRATIWTCDLTKRYVEINGDYRS
jgi:glutamate N-acetyltransferase/amino-acid N-acetyltransferase